MVIMTLKYKLCIPKHFIASKLASFKMKFIIAIAFLAFSTSAQPPPGCEKMPKIEFSECCKGMPDMSTLINDQIKQECKIEDHPKGRSCDPINCAFNKLNLLKPDNKIDINVANSIIDEKISKDWVSVGKTAAEVCVSETNRYSGDCVAAVFTGCFIAKIIKNCPASSFAAENQECVALKKFMETCPPPMM